MLAGAAFDFAREGDFLEDEFERDLVRAANAQRLGDLAFIDLGF